MSGRYGAIAFWHHVLVALLTVMLGLYFGAGLLIPLAAALLSFVLLTAAIDWIAQLRLGGILIPG